MQSVNANYSQACLYVAWSVCLSLAVCVSITTVSPAKTAEPIETPIKMAFGGEGGTHVDQRNHVLDGVHSRHLANITEQSVLGDAASYRYHDRDNFLQC